MKIKELYIQGFKSFPDPTRIYFSEGVNAIVGPNGQGKTNIIDAILWALGEQSPSVLRTEKSEDVLFLGSKTRRPYNISEVRLLLNMEDSNIREEIEIRRKYYRGGESDYQINRKSVRLKDILNIFRTTGRSRKYINLDQQTVRDIVKGKIKEKIIDMAGIEGYREKKQEALTRLKQVTADLEILDAHIHERGRIVRKLKREVNKLKKKDELKEEKNKLQFAKMYRKYETLKKRIEEKETRINYFEENRRNLYEKKESLKEKVNILKKKKEAIYTRITDIREEKNKVQTKLQNIISSLKNIKRLKEEKEKELQDIKEDLTREEKRFEKDLAQYNESLTEKEEKEKRINEIKNILLSLSTEIHKHKTLLDSIRAKKMKFRNKRDSLYRRKNEIKGKIEKINNEIKNNLTIVDRIEEELEEIKNELSKTDEIKKSRVEILSNIHKSIEKRIQTLTRKKENLEIEFNNLKKLSEEKELELMKELRNKESLKGKLFKIDQNLLNSLNLKGHIFNFVTVPDEYTKALYSALALYKRVFLTKETIEELPDDKYNDELYLMENRKCEVGTPSLNFTSISSILKLKDGFPETLLKYLKEVYIVDSFQEALSLSKKYKDASFVTKDGKGIFSTGLIFIPGKEENEIEMVSKIEKSKKNIEKIEEQIKITSNRIKKIEDQLTKTNLIINKLKDKLYKKAEELAVEKDRADRTTERVNLLKEKEKVKREDLNRLKEIIERFNIEEKDLKEREYLIEKELKKLEKILSLYRKTENAVEEVFSKKIKERKILIDEETEIKSRIQILKNTIAILGNNISVYKKEHEIKDKKLHETENIIRDYVKEIYKLSEEQKDTEKLLQIEQSKNYLEKAEKFITLKIEEWEREINNIEKELSNKEEELHNIIVEKEKEIVEFQNLKDNILYTTGKNPDIDKPEIEPDEDALEKVKFKLERFGEVNPMAEQDYEKEKAEYEELKKAKDDIVTSKMNLELIIRNADKEAERNFREKIEQVDREFKKLYNYIFEEGKAEITYDRTKSVWDTEVKLIARPKGKKIKSSLQSSGEQTLTAIAFFFALHNITPAPFILIDEIDAPLDDMNVLKFRQLLEEIAKNTQIILITHNKRTIEIADILYGVTMEEKGVSKIMSLQLKQVKEMLQNDKKNMESTK